MSADNYIKIKRFEGGWRWAMGFASDDREEFGESLTDADFRAGPFETAEAAEENAEAECSVIEYGFIVEPPVS